MSNIPAMPEEFETRTVMTPRTGTKICILIGLAFIVAAAYFYFVPVTSVRTTTGSIFGCGSAAHPASSTFAKGTCWRSTDVEKYRAIAALVIGIVTILLGTVMFGVDRRTETQRIAHTDDVFDDRRTRFGDEDRRHWDDGAKPRPHMDDRDRHDDEPRDRRRTEDQPVDNRDRDSWEDHDATRRDRRSRHLRDWDDDRR